MQKRLRDLLRVVVADLRHALSGGSNGQRGDLDRELERLGIAPDGMVTPFDALPNPSPAERRARRVAEAQLAAAPAAQRAATRAEVVDRAAYTWINRLLAIRAMEARGLINEILRSDPAYDGLSEALFILRQTQPQRAAGPDGGWWAVIEDACQAQAASLPGLFDLDDPSAALRPSIPALLRCVAIIGAPPTGYTAEEAEATFADPDAIGWAYQFYQEEAKTRTYAKLNSGGKATTRAEIASVTQLFTEPYMVKWLLQNSLGRTYYELHPDSKLPETWEYYIRESSNQRISDDSPIRALADLTFMDPCMGSGHFEREAFDMYFVMYREQYPDMSAAEIAERILTRHLHGIDLDPRAAQLTALTLYLRAWELVRDERRAKRLPGPGSYRPPAMNLATTPTGLTPGSLERHLQRHPEDRIYRPLLEGVFAALEQADVLGSLLRPGEQLDAAIRAFRTQGGGQLGLLAEDDDLNRLLGELARHDPSELKRVLLERIARSFAAEAADADDVAMSVFGREASEGLRLLQLLDRQYAVVATNPPYMGINSMAEAVRHHMEQFYKAGKRDLYATFILRCIGMSALSGRVAMVTMHGWLFARSYAEFRAQPAERLSQLARRGGFPGILRAVQIETLAHLGANAFGEIGGEIVSVVMFDLRNTPPTQQHLLRAMRLVGLGEPEQKAAALRSDSDERPRHVNAIQQADLLTLPQAPVSYWLGSRARLLLRGSKLEDRASIVQQVITADNPRFLRYAWEMATDSSRWPKYLKGGGYRKWAGFEQMRVDWGWNGARIRESILEKYPYLGNEAGWLLKTESLGLPGCTYSLMAGGSLGVRRIPPGAICDSASPTIALWRETPGLMVWLNSRSVSFILRAISNDIKFRESYVGRAPVPKILPAELPEIERWLVAAKSAFLARDPTEDEFEPCGARDSEFLKMALLSSVEGAAEGMVFDVQGFEENEVKQVLQETGTPAGWYPLIADSRILSRDDVPQATLSIPQDIYVRLASHAHINPDANELARVKTNLRALFEAGPGARAEDVSLESLEHRADEDDDLAGAFIPIPTETFLEELSQRLQIHPISVHWLLEELRAEGARCKPEELRLLEDRFSVLVLRLLGHRWPLQIKANEPVPLWADPDGIIPLTTISGETALAERVRGRLRAEDGDRGAQQVEALLLELAGQTLEEWLRRTFFARHVRQFKHRPIAWHLASTPTKDGRRKTKGQREPAFECLLYYQACRGDALARLRVHYVEPLNRLEVAAAAAASRRGDETTAAIAVSRVHELEEFATRLRGVEESGFACADLDRLLAGEPLDRWSGDGILPPASADELAAQERAWRVDINDGVRVNVAPLQLAGLLTGDVLRADDARKAIADRARWRSDERRWVREGVLPRCGWMDEDMPESPRWTERASEREAEQRRLEEKRRAVMERLADPGKESS